MSLRTMHNDFQIGRLERKLARLQAERLEAEAAEFEAEPEPVQRVNPYWRHLVWTFADDPEGLAAVTKYMAVTQGFQMRDALAILSGE